MTVALSVVFLASLAAIALLTLVEARKESDGHRAGGSATTSDWNAVARAHDLEMVTRSGLDEPLLRGTVAGRWVTVEDKMTAIDINVSFRSGTGTFDISDADHTPTVSGDVVSTGDPTFDESFSVSTRSPDEIQDYLTPARRNALLWLAADDDLSVDTVDEESLNIGFTPARWNPDDLISAIRLVVDVANIMEVGQKVFMAPPRTMNVSDQNDSDEDDAGESSTSLTVA